MSNGNHGLRFDIYERVHLPENVAAIDELEEIELVPRIQVIDQGENAVLQGQLVLNGIYRAQGAEGEQVALEHWIPVEITLPMNRVTRLDEVTVDIDTFDVVLLSSRALNLTGILSLRGISLEEEKEEHGWNAEVFTVSHTSEENEQETQNYLETQSSDYSYRSELQLEDSDNEEQQEQEVNEGAYVVESSDVDENHERQTGAYFYAEATTDQEQSEPAHSASIYASNKPDDNVQEEEARRQALQAQQAYQAQQEEQLHMLALQQQEQLHQQEEAEQASYEQQLIQHYEQRYEQQEDFLYAEQQNALHNEQPAEQNALYNEQSAEQQEASLEADRDEQQEQQQEQQWSPWETVNAEEISVHSEQYEQNEEIRDAKFIDDQEDSEQEPSLEVEEVSKEALAQREVHIALNGNTAHNEAQGLRTILNSSLREQAAQQAANLQQQQEELQKLQREQEEKQRISEDDIEWQQLFLNKRPEQNEFKRIRMCIVQKEDTLEQIALKYSVNPRELLLRNNLHESAITEGQLLYIP